MVVHYPWHPLVGQALTAKGRQRWGDQGAVKCELADGTWALTPEWMISREQCAPLTLAPPQRYRWALIAVSELLHVGATATTIGVETSPSC